MGLLDIFRANTKPNLSTTDKGILGPTYLEGLTEHIVSPKNLGTREWRMRIKGPSGQTKFKIKFYGNSRGLITGTEFAPAKVLAVDEATGKGILLFDGCLYGYNALCCNLYTKEQIENRPTSNFYYDKYENDLFEIVVSTYYDIDYDIEFGDQVDKGCLIELIDGSKVEFSKLKRDGYSAIQILGINESRNSIEIISEECA